MLITAWFVPLLDATKRSLNTVQVLLWTSCLLTSCAAAPVPALDSSHSYLIRETVGPSGDL